MQLLHITLGALPRVFSQGTLTNTNHKTSTYHNSPLAERSTLHLVDSELSVIQAGEVDKRPPFLAIHGGVGHFPVLLEHAEDGLLGQVVPAAINPHAVGQHALAKAQLQQTQRLYSICD